MFSTIGQYVGGKVLTALLVVGSAGAVIWFWRHPEDLQAIWKVVKFALVWLGFVVVFPWATFFVTYRVMRKESNAASALMLLGYALIDMIVAFCLIGGVTGLNTLEWGVLLLGFLSAAVYNLMVCEYLADRLENG